MQHSSSAAERIATQLAAEVEPLPAGSKLPAQRELVERYAASASTVAHALALLAARGLVESRPGAGSFRARQAPAETAGDTSWQAAALELSESLRSSPATARQFHATALSATQRGTGADVIDLNGGYLHPSLQPAALLRAALSRVAKRPEAWDRPPIGGLTALRDWFASQISTGLSRNDILIAPGGQAALATSLRALGQPGDPVVIEAPTYPGTIAAAQAAGLRPVPVALDHQGLIPDHLEEALTRTGARLIVIQPLHQNPTGASMGPQRQREIRQLARAHGSFVIEDDFARYLQHADAPAAGAPLIADDPDGTVIHIRSLTKAASPNLRIAAIASRGPATARLRDALTIDNLLVPAALQHTALDVVTAPGWRRAQRDLSRELRNRRDHAVAAITRHLGPHAIQHLPSGGYHLWLEVAAPTEVANAALAQGVSVTPGPNYYLPGHAHDRRVRVSYVAAPTTADLEHGIQRLAAAVAQLAEFGD